MNRTYCYFQDILISTLIFKFYWAKLKEFWLMCETWPKMIRTWYDMLEWLIMLQFNSRTVGREETLDSSDWGQRKWLLGSNSTKIILQIKVRGLNLSNPSLSWTVLTCRIYPLLPLIHPKEPHWSHKELFFSIVDENAKKQTPNDIGIVK